jgi:hypothetical protein
MNEFETSFRLAASRGVSTIIPSVENASCAEPAISISSFNNEAISLLFSFRLDDGYN